MGRRRARGPVETPWKTRSERGVRTASYGERVIYLCEQCGGAGAVAFERGPAAENCSRCGGVGLVVSDERTLVADLERLLSVDRADEGVLARAAPGAELRLLVRALQALERRIGELERPAGG